MPANRGARLLEAVEKLGSLEACECKELVVRHECLEEVKLYELLEACECLVKIKRTIWQLEL